MTHHKNSQAITTATYTQKGFSPVLFRLVALLTGCTNGEGRRWVRSGNVSVGGVQELDENRRIVAGETISIFRMQEGYQEFNIPSGFLDSGVGGCLLSEQDIQHIQSTAAFNGILLPRAAILSGAGKRNDLPEITKQKIEALFPAETVKELVQNIFLQSGISEILTKGSLNLLQRQIFEDLFGCLVRLNPSEIQTEVLMDWCAQKRADACAESL
ncbi:hypothetical protein AD952_11295 [Acetobacter cerevisiae]|uniref:Uncharacterized protein n=1 Tax=Acetobacter cerevisiae TaxID=178900 RepID=A0A149UST1_9PROT|nr:hypothetical protein [Acetobacter cerevisiae]KXV70925.1 hypothetical protein AD952_11295 [Acetobacter cerevisiae]